MTSKKEIHQLAQLCVLKGIKTVVFSPGSRNAPLVIAFNALPEIECLCIVDERAAAFFALGIAQATRQTVAIVCTSGTAALNYAPAIAEAFYQEIPMLVLTADRPSEWIDQADMQSIRQHNIYDNYIKKSFQYPQDTSAKDKLWFAERMIAEAINLTQISAKGPVHVNVPLIEPLYDFADNIDLPSPKNIIAFEAKQTLTNEQFFELTKDWKAIKKVLIIVGLNDNLALNSVINKLAAQDSVLVITESCSNLNGENIINAVDRFIDTLSEEEKLYFQPDLVISLGGMIVSKKIKSYLRKYQPKFHWSLRKDYKHQDTFKSLTHLLAVDEVEFLEKLYDEFYLNAPLIMSFENEPLGMNDKENSSHSATKIEQNYSRKFREIDKERKFRQKKYLSKVDFCDFKVVQKIIEKQPSNSVFQWGNSTPVRYANLFGIKDKTVLNFANRGVGGIDGAVSTAAGYAYTCPQKTVTHITGDLAFFYDSNALWNNHLPSNLRIILINNSGGNIFRIIPGPIKSGHLEGFFEHKHTQTAEKLCEAFNVTYDSTDNAEDLEIILNDFYQESQTVKLLEVKTDGEYSAKVLREFFKAIS